MLRSLLVCLLATALPLALPAQDPPAPRTTRCLVFDAGSSPIPDAAIHLARSEAWDPANPGEPVTHTDAAGAFHLTVPLAEGPHRLTVIARGHTTATLEVSDFLGADLGAILLDPATPIHGRVRDQDGRPVANAVVLAEDLLEPWSWQQGWSLRDAARTDRSGIFALKGSPATALRLRIRADGFLEERLAPVDAGSPLDVTLRPGGFVSGTVLGADGAPAAAKVTLVPRGHEPESVATAADGSFRLTWRQPMPARLVAVDARDPTRTARLEGLRGPQADLCLTLAEAAPTDPAADGRKVLRLRVLDPQGHPVPAFRAGAQWWGEVDEGHLTMLLPDIGRNGTDGGLDLPGPGEDEEEEGSLLIRAPGLATTIQKVAFAVDADATDDRPVMTLTVTMAKEALARGTVLDAEGQPLADVPVWAQPVDDGHALAQPPVDAGRTAADGTFTVGGLRPGTWHVQAGGGTTPVRGRRVRIAADGTSAAATIRMPRLVSLQGRCEQAMPPGTIVMFGAPMAMVGPVGDYGQAAIGADGTFQVALTDGTKSVNVMLPQPIRRRSPMLLEGRAVRIRAGDEEVRVSLRHGHGKVAGKVRCDGAQVPAPRLVVVAVPHATIDAFDFSSEVHAPVAHDGTFSLALPAGEHKLLLRDALTRVQLNEETPCAVEPGATARQDLACEVGEVVLTLRAVPAGIGADDGPGATLAFSRLEDGQRFWFGPGPELDLRDRAETVRLFLRPGETTLQLLRATDDDEDGNAQLFMVGGPAAGELLDTVTVQAGRSQAVTVDIPRLGVR